MASGEDLSGSEFFLLLRNRNYIFCGTRCNRQRFRRIIDRRAGREHE